MFRFVVVLLSVLLLSACYTTPEKVRVIGEKIVVKKSAKGDVYYDTLSATPPSFCFTNHHGKSICSDDMKGKIWICDFFFTHCPSICVKMERNLLKVNSAFKDAPQIFSILQCILWNHYQTQSISPIRFRQMQFHDNETLYEVSSILHDDDQHHHDPKGI